MSIPRFYINQEKIKEGRVEITGDHLRHLITVLRCRKGDSFKVFDGSGKEFLIKAKEVKKDKVIADIIDVIYPKTEPTLRTILCQAIPKGQKMDLIVQKATETGVAEIQPVITERSMQSISPGKLLRLQNISQSATEQSGRLIPVKIHMPETLKEVLEKIPSKDRAILFCCKKENIPLKKLLKNFKTEEKIFIFIGPEGDFTEKEIELAESFGVHPAGLGPRILRTETAGTVVLSIILYEAGEI